MGILGFSVNVSYFKHWGDGVSFLNSLFSIMSIVFFVVLVIGLIKPSWVKMENRGKAFLYFFSGMMICSTLHFLTLSAEDKERIKASSQVEAQ